MVRVFVGLTFHFDTRLAVLVELGEAQDKEAVFLDSFSVINTDFFGQGDFAHKGAPVEFAVDIVVTGDGAVFGAFAADRDEIASDGNIEVIGFDARDHGLDDDFGRSVVDVDGELGLFFTFFEDTFLRHFASANRLNYLVLIVETNGTC